jgi:hypothetical protein
VDKNILYGILSLTLGVLLFVFDIHLRGSDNDPRIKEFSKYYKFVLGVVFCIGGFYILLNRPY